MLNVINFLHCWPSRNCETQCQGKKEEEYYYYFAQQTTNPVNTTAGQLTPILSDVGSSSMQMLSKWCNSLPNYNAQNCWQWMNFCKYVYLVLICTNYVTYERALRFRNFGSASSSMASPSSPRVTSFMLKLLTYLCNIYLCGCEGWFYWQYRSLTSYSYSKEFFNKSHILLRTLSKQV